MGLDKNNCLERGLMTTISRWSMITQSLNSNENSTVYNLGVPLRA